MATKANRHHMKPENSVTASDLHNAQIYTRNPPDFPQRTVQKTPREKIQVQK